MSKLNITIIKFLAKNSLFFVFCAELIVILTLDLAFDSENSFIRYGVVAIVIAILMPRSKKINTQTGEKTQITWFLLKEPIFLDE